MLAGTSQKADTAGYFLSNSSHWPGTSLHIFSRKPDIFPPNSLMFASFQPRASEFGRLEIQCLHGCFLLGEEEIIAKVRLDTLAGFCYHSQVEQM